MPQNKFLHYFTLFLIASFIVSSFAVILYLPAQQNNGRNGNSSANPDSQAQTQLEASGVAKNARVLGFSNQLLVLCNSTLPVDSSSIAGVKGVLNAFRVSPSLFIALLNSTSPIVPVGEGEAQGVAIGIQTALEPYCAAAVYRNGFVSIESPVTFALKPPAGTPVSLNAASQPSNATFYPLDFRGYAVKNNLKGIPAVLDAFTSGNQTVDLVIFATVQGDQLSQVNSQQSGGGGLKFSQARAEAVVVNSSSNAYSLQGVFPFGLRAAINGTAWQWQLNSTPNVTTASFLLERNDYFSVRNIPGRTQKIAIAAALESLPFVTNILPGEENGSIGRVEVNASFGNEAAVRNAVAAASPNGTAEVVFANTTLDADVVIPDSTAFGAVASFAGSNGLLLRKRVKAALSNPAEVQRQVQAVIPTPIDAAVFYYHGNGSTVNLSISVLSSGGRTLSVNARED